MLLCNGAQGGRVEGRGVVDQGVQPTRLVEDFTNHTLEVRNSSQITVHRNRGVAPLGVQSGSQHIRCFGTRQIMNGYVRARLVKSTGDGCADSFARAGDKRPAASQCLFVLRLNHGGLPGGGKDP